MRHRRPTSRWRAPVGQNPAGMGTNARKRPRASARASPPHRLPVSTLCLCARPRSRGTSYRRVAPFATIRQIATHQGEEFPLLRTTPRPRPWPSSSAWPFLGTNLGPPLTFRASVYLILERLLRECAARVFFTYLLHPVPDRTRPRLQIANQPKPRQSTFASIHSRFPMALSTDSLPDSVERRRDGPQYRARRTPNLRTRVLQSQAHQPDARSPGPTWRALDRTRTAATKHTVILCESKRNLEIKWEARSTSIPCEICPSRLPFESLTRQLTTFNDFSGLDLPPSRTRRFPSDAMPDSRAQRSVKRPPSLQEPS